MGETMNEPQTARDLKTTVDVISLEQALVDADVAIARSRDLMLRLVELREQLAAERDRNAVLQADLDHAKKLYDEIVANRAYKYASKAWALRRAIGD
jgi:hypothetical protein